MSFILDALRKSEAERRRKSPLDPAGARYRLAPKKNSIWVPLLAVLLAVNAIIIAAVVVDGVFEADESEPASNVTENAGARPAAETVAAIAPATQVRAPTSPVEEQFEAETGSPQVAGPAVIETAAEPARETFGGSADDLPDDAPILPSMEELQRSGQLPLMKPLYVDIHVYAGDPSKRFVFVNMKKYREGERLEEGPMLQEITPTGVVLSDQGSYFTVSRD